MSGESNFAATVENTSRSSHKTLSQKQASQSGYKTCPYFENTQVDCKGIKDHSLENCSAPKHEPCGRGGKTSGPSAHPDQPKCTSKNTLIPFVKTFAVDMKVSTVSPFLRQASFAYKSTTNTIVNGTSRNKEHVHKGTEMRKCTISPSQASDRNGTRTR